MSDKSRVVMIVNGEIVTTADILEAKQARQRRQLALKRKAGPVIKPVFVVTFYCPGPFFIGWHLLIRTLKRDCHLTFRHYEKRIVLEVMRLFPCGYLPMIENLHSWMPAFARQYPRPTSVASCRGRAVCWILMERGDIKAVLSKARKETIDV